MGKVVFIILWGSLVVTGLFIIANFCELLDTYTCIEGATMSFSVNLLVSSHVIFERIAFPRPSRTTDKKSNRNGKTSSCVDENVQPTEES
jgi:hypothetical protein